MIRRLPQDVWPNVPRDCAGMLECVKGRGLWEEQPPRSMSSVPMIPRSPLLVHLLRLLSRVARHAWTQNALSDISWCARQRQPRWPVPISFSFALGLCKVEHRAKTVSGTPR